MKGRLSNYFKLQFTTWYQSMPPFLIASDFTICKSMFTGEKREREMTIAIPLITLDTKSTTMNTIHTDSADAHVRTQVHDNTHTHNCKSRKTLG